MWTLKLSNWSAWSQWFYAHRPCAQVRDGFMIRFGRAASPLRRLPSSSHSRSYCESDAECRDSIFRIAQCIGGTGEGSLVPAGLVDSGTFCCWPHPLCHSVGW